MTARNRDGTFRAKRDPRVWLKVLYWLLVVAGVWFAYLNIQPYERAVAYLSNQGDNGALLYFLSLIPVINGIAAMLAKCITLILGTILWAIIQIIEVLPLILYNHEGFVSFIISSAENGNEYEIDEGDDPVLRKLKRIYNALPTSIVSNLEYIKIATYTVDLLICTTVYAPVKSGNILDLVFVIATGQWNKLDIPNIVLTLITLFAIEFIVWLIIWMGKLSYAIKESRN